MGRTAPSPRALAAACLLTATAFAAAAGSAAAAPEWIDGPLTNTRGFVQDPFAGTTLQLLTGQFAGYRGERDASSPRVGDVFYLRGVVADVATVDEAPIMSLVFDQAFAPDVEFAISPSAPVVCVFHPTLDDPGIPDPANCSQTPQPAAGGGFFFGGRRLSPGQAFQIQVPVRVRAPKSGIATGPAAQFGVRVDPALGSPMLATQYVFVAPAPVAPPVVPPAAGGQTTGGGGQTTGAGDTVAPNASALSVHALRGVRTLRLRLSETGRLTVTVQRRVAGHRPRWRVVRTVRAARLPAGADAVRLGRLPSGAYRAVVVLRDAAGNTATSRVTFAVRG